MGLDIGPDTFLTLETLKTLAGQVAAVVMITQVVRSAFPFLATYWVRLVAVCSGIGVHLALAVSSGMALPMLVLAVLNGTMVALAAMKAAELIKGKPE